MIVSACWWWLCSLCRVLRRMGRAAAHRGSMLGLLRLLWSVCALVRAACRSCAWVHVRAADGCTSVVVGLSVCRGLRAVLLLWAALAAEPLSAQQAKRALTPQKLRQSANKNQHIYFDMRELKKNTYL